MRKRRKNEDGGFNVWRSYLDFIEILGTDGRIRFTLDVSLGIHEIKDIVVVTLEIGRASCRERV